MRPGQGPNPSQRAMMRLMGPYAWFATLFSFILPPIGFLMAYYGYIKDKERKERYFGWIVLMAISVLALIFIIALIIMLIREGGTSE